MDIVAKALEQQMLQSARIVEEQIDTELQKLERMDEDELECLKERRLEALKKAQKQKQVGNRRYIYVHLKGHLNDVLYIRSSVYINGTFFFFSF